MKPLLPSPQGLWQLQRLWLVQEAREPGEHSDLSDEIFINY